LSYAPIQNFLDKRVGVGGVVVVVVGAGGGEVAVLPLSLPPVFATITWIC
jgi:hypothetical protein